jgi:hypothetical protein
MAKPAPPKAEDGSETVASASHAMEVDAKAAAKAGETEGITPPAMPPIAPGVRLGLVDACNRLWGKRPSELPGISGFQAIEQAAGRAYDTLEAYEQRYEDWKKQPA